MEVTRLLRYLDHVDGIFFQCMFCSCHQGFEIEKLSDIKSLKCAGCQKPLQMDDNFNKINALAKAIQDLKCDKYYCRLSFASATNRNNKEQRGTGPVC